MKTNFIMLFLSLALSLQINAQDTIVKINGELIPAKITEVGTSTVTYKKMGFEDGPAFVMNKNEVLQIRYRSGRREEFAPAVNSATAAISSQTMATGASTTNPMSQNNPATGTKDNAQQKPVKGLISDKYKIETDGKKFFVNGQKIGQKDVDRLLSRSTNPAVVAAAKTAKITKIFQKITKITSFPTTISGGVACIGTFRTLILQATQPGPGAQPSSWVNAGLSFVGTLTFPVTAKLLKKQRVKLYDKAIDLYNIGKQ
ncbi:MAG: hypothetical protein ACXVP0_11865 [Bacteroidia bacterium]